MIRILLLPLILFIMSIPWSITYIDHQVRPIYMIDHTQLYKILRMTNVVSKLQERPFNRRPTARWTIDVWATSEHAWIDPGSVRGPEMNMFEQVCSGHIWTIWGHTDRQTWLKTLPSRKLRMRAVNMHGYQVWWHNRTVMTVEFVCRKYFCKQNYVFRFFKFWQNV